ncbi:MAG: chloride channel protein [Eubacteriales bacterium]|nr:chloride channel protein [Eubacteriales bacterium]
MKHNRFFKSMYRTEEFSLSFAKWVLLALLIGGIGGIVGTAFRVSVFACNALFDAHRWLVFLLPLGGLVIVFLYHAAGFTSPMGTNRIIRSVRREAKIPLVVAPLIFAATVLTHIFGGSAGREGAALQIGGAIGGLVSRRVRLAPADASLAVLAGMAAVFAALFGVPVASVVFALEVISVGIIHYAGLVPCSVASFAAFFLSEKLAPFESMGRAVIFPSFDWLLLLKCVVMGLCCAGLSILFVLSLDLSRGLFARFVSNAYLKILLGGLMIIGLSLLFSTGRYNGSGIGVIRDALNGQGCWYDFLLKILFTAITLGVGYKGGEIVPTLFIGASMGCWAGALLGMDPSLGAALGLCGTFCGAVNCPLASLVMGIELFGGTGLPYIAICCFVSYMMSGYFGLYESQKIMYSKLHARLINIHTRA